jgi:hypothetical protein
MKSSIKSIGLSFSLFVSLLSFLSVTVVSCKKDSPAPAPTKTQLLTGKNWKVTALTVDPPRPYVAFGPAVTDWYSQMKGCEQDNLFKFNSDGTMIKDEGATKCNVNDPQTISGTWVFNTDQTIVTTTINSVSISYTIVELTTTTLKATYVDSSFGTNYTFTITLMVQS